MKLLHLSDLHLGKRVYEFSMVEDQRYLLNQILTIIREKKVDAVMIAGDIYDKLMPSVEAVRLFDEFLSNLYECRLPVLMISGNHDQGERLGFGTKIFSNSQIYFGSSFDGKILKVDLSDAFGVIHFYLLPFLRPVQIAAYFEAVNHSHEAMKRVIEAAHINTRERNVLIAHQFVTAGCVYPEQSDSEQITLGGLDSVDVSAFDDFDYVALGHIHRPQKIGRESIRYAGSLLKYSSSEALQKKSVTLVTLEEKGTLHYELIPLHPLHDLRVIRGPIEQLILASDTNDREDYIHAVITNEEEVYDAIGQLRSVYPHLVKLEFDNLRTRACVEHQSTTTRTIKKNPMELFEEFYMSQNNQPLNASQRKLLLKLLSEKGETE